MVIDGFRVVMTGKQLAAELVGLAKRYETQAGEIEHEFRDREERKAERNARHCQRDRDRARELRFFAEHLIEDATYRLTVQDVDYLELTDVQLRRGRP